MKEENKNGKSRKKAPLRGDVMVTTGDGNTTNPSFQTVVKRLGTNVQAQQVGDINIHPSEDRMARRLAITASVLLVSVALAFSSYKYVTDWSVEPDVDSYIAWIEKGDSLIAANEFEQAKAAYEQAALYSPGDSAAFQKAELTDKALQYMELNDEERAEKAFEMVLTIAPDLDLEVGMETEESLAASYDGIGPKPMTVRIKRLMGGIIEIRVNGGKPFPDPNKPYDIKGLTDAPEKIEWRKEGDTYIALLHDMKNTSILSIKVSDSKGNSKDKDLPAITSQELFNDQLSVADDLFDKQAYQRAKESYSEALAFEAENQHCLDRIAECEAKIEELEAQNMDMVAIKGGLFGMGSNTGELDESPIHQVSVKDFYLSKYEVTVKQYRTYCQATGTAMPNEPTWGWKDDHPIVNVTWEDAKAFCVWAGGRLPTEAEWEFAARGGVKTNGFAYSGSNDVSEVAWYRANSSTKNTTHAVGKTPVFNELGLADMSGNVWEWCADWFGETYYASSANTNPKGPLTGSDKVFRGGSWKGLAEFTAVTYRNHRAPNYRSPDLGFRVAKDQLRPHSPQRS